MRIFITSTVGNSTSYVFDVEKTTTIRELKEKYVQKAKRQQDLEKILLELDGIEFGEDDKTLFDYNIESDSMLNLIYYDFVGRNPCFGRRFVDVSNNAGLKRVEWGKTAPDWRIAYPGLCLEGICKNKHCVANGNQVIMSLGYIEFDVVGGPSRETTKCPKCFKFVNPILCGFNNCWWKYEGKKQLDESEAPEFVENDWQEADNAYHYFDENKSGIVHWRYLILKAVKTKPVE
ncbi:unnamed protein product [Rotaria sordida]|uniref:Ubiquitin-like domain-containing protein n=1 Tax=Rotaria sordida TaxID=392033 RepID=A0A819QEW6_9BILA|nr:unnamed protein product [Rotaria sordida]CAF1320698.1 unnamed protein product [Rotaria sordida]CAF4023247.1 unnamed protein product [Rotaria sordida]